MLELNDTGLFSLFDGRLGWRNESSCSTLSSRRAYGLAESSPFALKLMNQVYP